MERFVKTLIKTRLAEMRVKMRFLVASIKNAAFQEQPFKAFKKKFDQLQSDNDSG